jgi:hypothetical protein
VDRREFLGWAGRFAAGASLTGLATACFGRSPTPVRPTRLSAAGRIRSDDYSWDGVATQLEPIYLRLTNTAV